MLIVKPSRSLIEVVPMAGFKRFGTDVLRSAMNSGGFYAARIPERAVEILPDYVKAIAKPHELECVAMMEGTSFIQVVKELYERLSEQDRDALLLHEEGHILHGHIEPGYHEGKVVVGNFLVDLQSEIEADAYSASKVGKRRMAIALTHAVENLCEFAFTKKGTVPLDLQSYQRAISEMFLHPFYRQRFAALQ